MSELEFLALAAAAKKKEQKRTLGHRIKDNFIGLDDGYTSTGEKIAALLNKGGEAMTAGLVGDETAAAFDAMIGRGSYEERRDFYRDQEEKLEQESPGLALGADVGGSLLGAFLPGGQIGTLAKGAKLMPRVGASVGAGAGMGGLYGYMEGEGIDDRQGKALVGAGLGGVAGGFATGIGSGVQRIADRHAARKAITHASQNAPSTEALREAGSQAYRQLDEAGVQIKPEKFNSAKGEILNLLRSRGLDELPGPGSLTPKSARVVQIADEMSNAMADDATSALPFSSLDQLRRHAGTAAASMDKTDASLGAMTIEKLDDLVKALGPDDIADGDLQTLKSALPKARDLWSRMSRSQLVDDAIEAGQDYVSGPSSGIRNQFRRILRSDKLSRGFSDAEKAAMRRVVNGSTGERLINLLGGGLGQLTQVGMGLGVGGLPGALVGAGAAAATRKASEKITGKNAEIVRALIANGGMSQLPVASDSSRKIIEGLLRRTGAVAPQ